MVYMCNFERKDQFSGVTLHTLDISHNYFDNLVESTYPTPEIFGDSIEV